MINNLNKKLPGGVGDNTPTDIVDPTQLSLGVQIEMEHTNDPEIAKEIALDHLTENPEYYTKLIKAGLASEFQPSYNSGFGDPEQGFNDHARVGNNGLQTGNMGGTIGGTSDGQVSGRNSDPIINKTIDIELEEAKKKKKKRPKPTNPALWARAKAAARAKFDVYPSAYANGWAARWYKSKGGGWRMSEDVDESVVGQVFDGPSAAETSPSGNGTYSCGYDLVGFAENKENTMKKEQFKNILRKLINETVEELDQVGPVPPEDAPEGDETDGGETKTQNIVLNLDRDTAQKLHDLLMAQLATKDDTEGGVEQPVAGDMTDDQLPPEGEEPNGEQDAVGEITFEQSQEIGESKKKWIQNAINPSKKGALKKSLGVKAGQKIPAEKLKAAAKKGGKTGQRARLALTLSKLKKK